MATGGYDEEVLIGIVGDEAPYVEAVDRAKGKTEEFKKSAESAGGTAAKEFKGGVAAVTGVIGAITAAVGVATLFYNIGNKIGEALWGAEKAAKSLADSLDFKNVDVGIKATSERIAELQTRLADIESMSLFGRALFAGDEEQVRKELENLNNIREVLDKKAAEDRGKKEQDDAKTLTEKTAKDRKDRLDKARQEERAAFESTLTDEERASYDSFVKREDLRGRIATEKDAEIRASLKRQLDSLEEERRDREYKTAEEVFNKKLELAKKLADEERKRASEVAKQYEDMIQRVGEALRGVTDRQNQAIDSMLGRITGSLNSIEDLIRAKLSTLRR